MTSEDQRIQDPTGFEVILTEQCWSEHITKRHPEMTPFWTQVVDTVQTPDAIYLGRRDPSTRIYMKKYPSLSDTANWPAMLVYVRANGYVATAHLAAKFFRQLGQQIWPSE